MTAFIRGKEIHPTLQFCRQIGIDNKMRLPLTLKKRETITVKLNFVVQIFILFVVTACVSVEKSRVSKDSQGLTDSRYVYSYCLFRGGVTLGYKNNYVIDQNLENKVIDLCNSYRDKYKKFVEMESFQDRADLAGIDLSQSRLNTSRIVLREAEKIVFNGVRAELKRVKATADD